MPADGKIKSKDLSYDSSLPPFLQRLHDRNAGRGDTDRHERPTPRPTKARDPNEDDGPTVVDESGETLTKEELARLTAGDDGAVASSAGAGDMAAAAEPIAPSGGVDGSRKDARITDGTASKKRKAAKVVGVGDARDENAATEVEDEKATEKPMKKAKRKAKPIKLAFDNEDET